MTIEELGFTKEELQERIIARAVQELFETSTIINEDGDIGSTSSPLYRQLNQAVKARIDEKINELAEQHVLPRVSEMIENLCLQETNKWGEKTGEKLTFVEYLVHRADFWMREEVDFKGKTKAEESYSWKKNTTRIAYLIDEYLQYNIERAMKEALKNANDSIVGGLKTAVQIKLEEVAANLKVEVKTK